MDNSALPHSLAGGLPFSALRTPKGQKGHEKFFSEDPM